MIRWVSAAAAVATLLSAVVVQSAAASAPAAPHSLHSGSVLAEGQTLQSVNKRYTAAIDSSGRLVIKRGSTIVWHTHRGAGPHPRLRLRPSGNVTLLAGSHRLWASNTAGSHATTLTLRNDGVLALRSTGGQVWTSDPGNLCRSGSSARRVDIDLTHQSAKLCAGDQQVLTTPITSGATAYGDGTPTGTWHVQAKQRDTTLYPAAGGAYPVHYWMPYDGAYGMHDSPWQNFPYGSSKYRTQGSHGCVHFPRAAIAWMFAWAPIGTTVHIYQ
jgi:lipoprotein-anchoring transpeptidase ErfK/SrfK